MLKRKKWIAFSMMILWMALIFYFSAQAAPRSSEQSMGIVKIIRVVLERTTSSAKNIDVSFWENVERYLRKMAHAFIYFVLGILTLNFMINCRVKRKKLTSLGICFAYAISDEFHQLFVPGRSGQISDVFVDFTGSIFGVLLFTIVYFYFFSRRKA